MTLSKVLVSYPIYHGVMVPARSYKREVCLKVVYNFIDNLGIMFQYWAIVFNNDCIPTYEREVCLKNIVKLFRAC